MWPTDTLKGWHDFYLLVGTAGATLLGLLFVAVSLGRGFLTKERQRGTRTFMSPVVIHFTSVFFLCAVGLFPSHLASVKLAHDDTRPKSPIPAPKALSVRPHLVL